MNEAARGRLRRTTSGRRPPKRTPITTPQTLVWTCDECGGPIKDGDGYITVDYADIREHRARVADWNGRHPRGTIYSLAETFDYPMPCQWRVLHRGCDLNLESEDYWIAVERIRTPAALIHWAAHLGAKTWIQETTWTAILHRQADALGWAA